MVSGLWWDSRRRRKQNDYRAGDRTLDQAMARGYRRAELARSGAINEEPV
jgi:hypothetical protein